MKHAVEMESGAMMYIPSFRQSEVYGGGGTHSEVLFLCFSI
jgi:hypothetical protein